MVRRALPARQAPEGQPVRTCVGCRQRVPATELLRIVAVERGADTFSLVPDPSRRQPGRGAHLHPDPACLAMAERRRAFGRALRVSGVIDAGAVTGYIAGHHSEPPTAGHPSRPEQQGRTTSMSTR
ncbi:MAG TPA: YlxR family protein [Micromonosporaceae bacterium]